MYDGTVGTRGGTGTERMKPVVEKLTNEDLVPITAPMSSRTP
jgi:hypothetical protein